MTDYHGRIMNIPEPIKDMPEAAWTAYSLGHRDARNVAAEIAVQADAQIAAITAERDTALAEVEWLKARLEMMNWSSKTWDRKWKRRAKEAETEAKTAYAALDEVRAAARDEAQEAAVGCGYSPVQPQEQISAAILALKHPPGSERAQESPLLCAGGCGRPYSVGPDVLIPDEAWLKIAPRPDGGGVLCPNCMHDRLRAAGYDYGEAPGFFMSGPMAKIDLPFRLIGQDGKRMWTAQPATERAQEADTVPSPVVGGAELEKAVSGQRCGLCGHPIDSEQCHHSVEHADGAEPENAVSGQPVDWYALTQAAVDQEAADICEALRALEHADGNTVAVMPCTCHPDDNPPRPCPRKYALTECRLAVIASKPLATDQHPSEPGPWESPLSEKTSRSRGPGVSSQWPACEVCGKPCIPEPYVTTGPHRAEHVACRAERDIRRRTMGEFG